MTDKECREYWQPARDKLMSDLDLGYFKFRASQKLAKLLEYEYPKTDHWRDIPLTEDLKHKLQLLTGPYRNAIIKTLEIRKQNAV